MAVRFGCFISYAHDDGRRLKTFIQDFTEALVSELGAYLDDGQKVALDKDLLAGGVRHEPALAQYMCQSACWILVYVPKYRHHPWCRQEYRAMRVLEAERRDALGSRLPRTRAMILPVLLSGNVDDLPAGMPELEYVEDFSSFMVGHQHIIEHPEFQHRVRKMAENIWGTWRILAEDADLPDDCHVFEFPAPDDNDWAPEVGGLQLKRPT